MPGEARAGWDDGAFLRPPSLAAGRGLALRSSDGLCTRPVSPRDPWWWFWSSWAARTIGGRLVNPPPSQIILRMGKLMGQRGQALCLRSHGYFRTQLHDPRALRISPGRSISLSLGPGRVGLWLFGIYKIYPANFCHVTFLKCRLGQVALPPPTFFSRPSVFLEESHARHKTSWSFKI